jgi:hypothetical protein
MRKRYRAWREDRQRRCRINMEYGGYFIGRQFCMTHNVAWDDGGRCPRLNEDPGQPFEFARYRYEDRW